MEYRIVLLLVLLLLLLLLRHFYIYFARRIAELPCTIKKKIESSITLTYTLGLIWGVSLSPLLTCWVSWETKQNCIANCKNNCNKWFSFCSLKGSECLVELKKKKKTRLIAMVLYTLMVIKCKKYMRWPDACSSIHFPFTYVKQVNFFRAINTLNT